MVSVTRDVFNTVVSHTQNHGLRSSLAPGDRIILTIACWNIEINELH